MVNKDNNKCVASLQTTQMNLDTRGLKLVVILSGLNIILL